MRRSQTSVFFQFSLHRIVMPMALLLLLALLGACAPASADDVPATQGPVPTFIPSATPEYNNLDDALLVGQNYLDAWQRGDFPAMYQLLSIESQQTTPYQSFIATYQSVYEEIRLLGLQYALKVAARESSHVIVLTYDVTFESNVIGQFMDADREIRLVLDDQIQAWGVAWSPGNIFREMENGARLRMETFPPRRASIYDRNGEILADTNGQIVSVNIIRSRIPDLAGCVNVLSQVLNQPVENLQSRISTFGQEQLAEIGQIERNTFLEWQTGMESACDARFDNRPVRRYINGDLAPHIIGYVGYPNVENVPELEWEGFEQDSIVGRTGIEQTWNSALAGRPGGRLSIVAPSGDTLRLLGQRGAEPGQSVYLTIDANLQRATVNLLNDAYRAASESWGRTSNGASIIVLDVRTGAVLAMVSYPTFNANAFNNFPIMGQQEAQRIVQEVQSDERRPQLNRATQGGYPSGSTMKIMTAIAALDSGVFGMDERFVSVGVWDKDIPRRDWLAGGHGSQTMSTALTVSCNTCFYEAGYRMDNVDPYLLPGYANRLGLGLPTGIGRDTPEIAGTIGTPDTKDLYAPDENGWKFSDAVNMAIGQGFVEVTPIQMVRMYAAVATDGTLYRPQLVARTGLLDDISYEMTPDPMSNIDISPEILEYVRAGLCDVTVRTYGTAEFVFRNSRLQEIGVCGKTGTAETASGPTHAWFIGYAPRNNPEIAVIAMVENAGEGSEVAAPLVREVMEYYFYEMPR